MELNDLRQQWQQAGASPANPAGPLRRPGKQPLDLIGRMRRNVWAEIIAAPFAALLPLLVLHDWVFRLLYLGVMAVLTGTMAVYYVRQLRLLQQMGQADVSLKGHLQVLCAGLRQLLRFYYRLTIWTGPATLLLVLGYYQSKELRRPTGPHWPIMGLVVAVVVVLGVGFQFGIIRFTRWYLQRLYGRHLDRLEGQLRELDEAGPA